MNPQMLSASGLASLLLLSGLASNAAGAALKQKAGRIIAVGKTRDVTFKTIRGAFNDHIDDAYRAMYDTSSYLGAMISERSRAATVLVLPRDGTQ
ncbi:DUF2255 family protein [Pseudomonas sp. N3-W]|uniref:DUF2255 family protein n=1 Tax=Pseudomonas sp. N3-W TaxID=2975049 RepID=UPI00217E7C99|nr:DUF2255 family protein [Pseudomonas sp. N3-W]UWF47886.1 DUF2255 family protein [Pseudomonas sp. N3-W]